ncbi:hypothetical protein [Hymenobacter aranciens]|uniref:hypothetical protein n=1 Tax=Hymenobacter aranciens TaxID=3063996 RepID=UPI00272AE396|nr:hypothetical protein [Hymenobacter sp. ASUV-10]
MLLTSRCFWGILVVAIGLGAHAAQAQTRLAAPLPSAPSDEQSYKKEFVYGVNFNTQAGLIGGVAVRSARMLDERLLRFWSIEGVMLKNKKEEQRQTGLGVYTPFKANYAFSLRPSFGFQRILFRKAADAGVQVNGLLSAGPSIGLLMPYYITYDYTLAQNGGSVVYNTDDIANEAYDPAIHTEQNAILDRAPLFSGIGGTQVVPGFHLRGGLSFEYGRYRDAVTGVEVGFLMEAYSKRMVIFKTTDVTDDEQLNRKFFPSVYLTLYFGQRS